MTSPVVDRAVRGPKLGLHSVDRETFERTPKPSAGVYAELVREARGL